MKQVHNTHKSSSSSSEDVISRLPEDVVTIILNCLPIHDAVRTCILSKQWRLMWRLVTQVLFDGISRYLQGIGPEGKYCYDGKNLSRQILCHLKGPVTKFVFTIPNNMEILMDVEDWILLLLSLKGIKEMTLINKHETPLKLPAARDLMFACPELRHLNLHNCCLHDYDEYNSSSSNVIINLLSLELDRVTFSNLGEIITTHAPFLEILKISYREPAIGKLKLVDHIAKLENLKTLHVPLMCMIEDEENNNTASSWRSIIIQLGVYLPKPQELNLYFHKCMFLGDDDDVDATKWVPTAATACFPCLKSLALYPVDFTSGSMLSCVIGMIWCSPNLHTLKITADYNYLSLPMAWFSSELENNSTTRRLLQLQNAVFTSSNCSTTEVDLLKYLLVCSPLLNKIVIHTRYSVTCRVKSEFAATLLMFPRASPNAQVVLLELGRLHT